MSNQNTNNLDAEIDLLELLKILWAGKIKIIVITILFAICSVYYALSIPDQYKATSLLTPTQSSGGGVSSAMSQFGGLASLAGVNIGTGESNEAKIAIEIMQSWSFIENFIAENNLAVELSTVNGWNKSTNDLLIDDGVYDLENNKWIGTPPSSWSLFQLFSGILLVSENTNSGLITVSVEYYSPQIAKHWLDLYVSSINTYMQKRKIVEASRTIEYLEEQIAKTSIAGMQEVFYTIIEEQTKNKMLAVASPEYVFTSVSRAMIPEEKSQPRRSIICILGTFLGGIFSTLLVLIMHYTRKQIE
jgi:LPS O-antigen subunit length determinant protein (WzzB/FepE family)